MPQETPGMFLPVFVRIHRDRDIEYIGKIEEARDIYFYYPHMRPMPLGKRVRIFGATILVRIGNSGK